jgi:hypothetical protein
VPEKKLKQTKIYLSVALSIVLVIAVYVRFVHKKTTHAAVPVQYKARCIRLAIPQGQVPNVFGGKRSELGVHELGRFIPRDIFEPAKAPPQRETQSRPEEPLRSTMSLKLKGTITGGENPIAVINDKFVYAGDRIGDYEVISIGKDEVVLTSDTHSMVLKVLKVAEK